MEDSDDEAVAGTAVAVVVEVDAAEEDVEEDAVVAMERSLSGFP